MKKLNLIFAALTIALLSIISMNSDAGTETRSYVVFKVNISNHELLSDCPKTVVLRMHPNNMPVIEKKQAYSGTDTYYFLINGEYTGDVSAHLTMGSALPSNIEVVSPIASNSWISGPVYNVPIYVHKIEL